MKSTILLVEDEAGLADSLKTEFELENFNVLWANDGLIALDMFRQNVAQIDLIIFGLDAAAPGRLQCAAPSRRCRRCRLKPKHC